MKLMNLSGMSAYRIQLLLDSINNALTMVTIAHRSHDESRVHERQFATLTKCVQEILDKLLAGSIRRQIARELGTSMRTVEAHRQNLLRSTGTT